MKTGVYQFSPMKINGIFFPYNEHGNILRKGNQPYLKNLTNMASSLPHPNETAAQQHLSSANWPNGLQQAFLSGCRKVPIRFIICDDSGSMMESDGQHVVAYGMSKKFELSQFDNYDIQISLLLRI